MVQQTPAVMSPYSDLPEDPTAALRALCTSFPNGVVFTSSLGKEDQAITFLIAQAKLPVRITTLDTGRLFPQAYELLERTTKRLGVNIDVFVPEAKSVEAYVNQQGINAFYTSIAARKACCAVRKLEPLKRAVAGASVWVTGMRAVQSENREHLPRLEPASDGPVKFHPLVQWTDAQLDAFIEAHNIPINPLHAKGFPSIGCAPCTQAVAAGDHPRSGRWAWEQSAKECGLHTH